MNDIQTLRGQLAQRNQQLQDIAVQLKTELFGIDRVIDSVRAWYVLPELVTRPVIVCLWGLTGTGKTQPVRRRAREGEPGILALDGFQRFCTIDNKRAEVRVERYQDVWALLSDGRMPPALSLLGDIESSIAEAAYDAERAEAMGDRLQPTPTPSMP
ncbi:hypothetical protein [Aquabacterium sp.]|uniref:hypothetical protein n=1 Tax=Aquabacterium sp. TaxID=1872578 RepID=UPI00351D12A9